jgi:peptide/nickel transport system substrate-binding protein
MNYQELRALLRKRFHLPKERPVRRTIQSFTLAERGVFYFFTALFIIAGLSLLWQVSESYLVRVPTEGGSLTEGVVGNPRFINPVLALSEADKNLTALIYSGLVRVTPQGEVVNDLASAVTISKDLLTYSVTIDAGARFHDGTPVTADDVIFTVGKIIDPLIKSPRRGNWEGVTATKIDDQTVTFTLKKPYAPFIYNLTIGILPRHIWKNVTADEFSFSQFNTLPVGSGPYKISRVERNEGGIPDYYELSPFAGTDEREPYLKKIVFRFYPSETMLIEAYNSNDIESVAGLSPERLIDLEARDRHVVSSPLPRIFAVFFNQTHSKALQDKAVRQALNLTAPRQEIVKDIFGGYATAINTPFPAGLYDWATFAAATEDAAADLNEAQEILASAGWKPNAETGLLEKTSGGATIPLSFSISTGDAPELKAVAEKLKASWQKLGAQVTILAFETGELNQGVIRPRNFDALLFGEMVGRDADLYPFWHSSQRNDPGLNIALYANSKADKLLEDARSAADQEALESKDRSFSAEIAKDVPAVFLYTPSFLYVLPAKVQSVAVGALLSSQDRFAGVRDWYVETDKVWKIFLK